MKDGRCDGVWPAWFGAALAILAYARSTEAQDTGAGQPTFKPTTSTARAASDQSNQLLGPIERLPASAYPTAPVRGIEGGSLWMNFHGAQWPYYPKTGIGVSGYAWIDTGYEHMARGSNSPSDPSFAYFVQQGMFLLRVTPTWSNGRWFVQGQAELVAEEDQSQGPPVEANVFDMWIKVGKWRLFDVQVGRFQGWEVYHRGMGLDNYTLEWKGAYDVSGNIYTANLYGVTTMWDYPQSLGEGALHLYPADWLRFEVQARYGDNGGYNTAGARPVGILDVGWLKLKVGYEYQRQAPQNETPPSQEVIVDEGFGGGLSFVIDPYAEFGVNAAYGTHAHQAQDGSQETQGDYWTYSAGAFANVRIVEDLIIGGGLNYTYLQDKQYDATLRRSEDFDQWQGFGALQYYLFKRLFIKGVVGYALADFNPNRGSPVWANRVTSFRLRLEYLF